MEWLRWVVVSLATVDASYMVVDAVHALTRGDYITPRSGEHAGQLGPWARLVSAVGIEPRGTGLKVAFVVYGLVWLAVTVAFALEQGWAWVAMLALAIGSLWYLVPGTLLSAAMIVLLLLPSVRETYPG